MKQVEQFIQIPASVYNQILSTDLNPLERGIYLTLARDCTYKYGLYGIYKKASFYTLRDDAQALYSTISKIEYQIVQVQRAVKKLEKLELVQVLCSGPELLIAVNCKKTLTEALEEVEKDVGAFNIYAKRLRELEKNIGCTFSIKLNSIDLKPSAMTEQEQKDFDKIIDSFGT